MKKLFFLLACVAMSVLSMAQVNQLVWANGRLLYGTPVESVDSLTYNEMQDIDTLHLLLPRTLIKVVHDTVYIHDTVYVETDCGENIPSAGIGVFSVSADKQVTFSKGNLQYHPANDEWRFAENQWDYISDVHDSITQSFNGWIDWFIWGFGANPIDNSLESLENVEFVDWGINKIGKDNPYTWRTLTIDEWRYLRWERKNYASLCGIAQVNGVNGLILLPDNWECPDGVTFKSGFHSNYGVNYYVDYQTFSINEWTKLEASGAVFLPASGGNRYSYLNRYEYVQLGEYYHAATKCSTIFSGSLYFDSTQCTYVCTGIENTANSVRLVKDL